MLAVNGANLHRVSSEVLEDAVQRKNWALQVQRMMVTVLQARLEAESENMNNAENMDRGLDCDCMELDCMEFLDDDVDNGEGILNDAS